MPSGWFALRIAELLTYGSSLIGGAHGYCGAHAGTAAAAVVPWLDGVHAWVRCLT